MLKVFIFYDIILLTTKNLFEMLAKNFANISKCNLKNDFILNDFYFDILFI